MTEDVNVTFEAINPSGIKLLNRLYDQHLVLNDLGVRLDQQLSDDEAELTIPTQEDLDNLRATFMSSIDIFSDIVKDYGDTQKFAANFGGLTRTFAEKLLIELKTYNDGVADIAKEDDGLASYDEDKLNDWINTMMGLIVETNEAFNQLIEQGK